MGPEVEIRRLRRALRDLVALSTIPAAWVGREPPAIAAGLADVLVGALHLNFAFVRLCDPGGGAAVEATRGDAGSAFPEWLQRRLTVAGSLSRTQIVADVAGIDQSVRGVVIPIGVNGEAGLVAAACDRAEFPDETDQLLLSVAANHAATACQSARLIDAHSRAEEALARARDELEQRVAERTAELSRTTTEAVAAQQRFRDLVNSVDGIVWEADAQTLVFSFVSEQAERILGYPAQRWLREPTFWKDHIHPDDRDGAVRFCQEATAQKRRHDFEYRMIAADGRVVWFSDLVTMAADGDRPTRLRGVMVDITERKRAEEERQARRWVVESLDRVNLAIQGTNDLEQMMSDVLDAALSIFGCDRAWLMHPCDPEAVSHEVKMQRTRPEFPSLLGVGDEVPIDPETTDMFRTVRASSGPVQFGPHSAHPLSSELAQRRRVQSRIVMALYPKGEPPYIFGASQCSYPRVWTAREEFLFREIGRRLEDALTSLSIFHRLRESEKRYRHIFESTGVSIWEEDFSRIKAVIEDLKSRGVRDLSAYVAAHPQFVDDAIAMVKVIDVNAASLTLFAADDKAELLASLNKIFVPETRETFVEELVAIAEGRPLFEAESVLRTLKGERLAVLVTITFPPQTAEFSSVLVSITDITERKRAAEELRNQAALLGLAHDAIIVRDAASRIVFWNSGAEKTYGWTAAEAIGQISHELLQTRFPVSQQAVNIALQESGEWEGELTHITRHGRAIVVTSRQSRRRDEQGVGVTILEINRDVTERRQAEDLTRQVFESSPDAVAVIGRDYRYQRVNPVYERNWRMPAETIVGMHLAELRGSDVFEQALKANLDRCFAGEQVSYGEWLTNAVGRVYHVRTYTPLRSPSNEVNAALVISRDLTDHMLAVEALQKVQAELAHVTRVTTLGELAASIAHEVNQPLAAIVADANASLNWLASPNPRLDTVREALDAIVTDGHRAAEVIQRIRQLATKSEPQKTGLDINGVIREVLPLIRAELLGHHVSLRLELAPELPSVLGDRVQLQQVLINLVMNAIEAMTSVEDRPRELTIRSHPHEADHVAVAVKDTGVGIAANHADELFSAFFTTKPGGMGMGLSISRGIIESHAGRMWTMPNEPHGAIFQLSLPVATRDVESSARRIVVGRTDPYQGRVDARPRNCDV